MNKKIYGTIVGYLNMITSNLVAFFLTPIMILTWGDAEYGLYKLMFSFMAYFFLMDVGIANSIVKFISEYTTKEETEKESNYFALLLFFYALVSLVILSMGYGLSRILPYMYQNTLSYSEIKMGQNIILLLPILAIGTIFMNFFIGILRGHQKHIFINLINLCKTLVRFLLLYYALILHNNIINIIVLDIIICFCFTFLVLLYVIFKIKLTPKIKGINFVFVKSIFSFSGYMFLATIGFQIFWSVDSIIIGSILSTEMVAIYSIGTLFIVLFQTLSSVTNQIIAPEVMKMVYSNVDKNEMNQLMVDVGRIKFFIILLPMIGFVFLGNHFISLWVGRGFELAYVVALIVIVPQIFSFIQDVPVAAMYAKNKHKWYSITILFAGLLNCGLTIIMVNLIGIIGAAIGTTFAFVFIFVFYASFFYKKTLDFDMKRLYLEVILKHIPSVLLVSILSLIISQLGTLSWFWLGIQSLLVTLLYIIILWTIMLNSREKGAIKNILRMGN
ncbi:oligosaccharide flippase family protein [Paenibacillus sp. FJAT-27812]|uniref:oligosaccharide flippase family protein n=1 Tax=Paenibacillus sp. FJAT-27812 TaxID=1684143 RepID=UPI0006A7CE7E|nr:oligosaccharide flippase family protein [Paenibacillus sp. FJAT-27812]